MSEAKNYEDRKKQLSESEIAFRSEAVSGANRDRVVIRVCASTPSQHERTPPFRGGVSECTRVRGRANAPAAPALRAPAQNASLDDVLDLALKLDRKAAKHLLDQLALRMQTTDKAMHNRDLETWSECVHHELNRDLGAADSYGILQVRKAMGEPECWRPVEAFMRAAGLDHHTSAQRRAMYMLLAELLIEHVRYETRRQKFGLVLNSVARYVVDLVAIFDDSFPGYLRSGLAYMVADQQQRLATGVTVV